MTIIQALLVAHGFSKEVVVSNVSKAQIRTRMEGFEERHRRRVESRNTVQRKYYASRQRKAGEPQLPIGGTVSKSERRMIRNALAMHEQILAEERRRTYAANLLPSERQSILSDSLSRAAALKTFQGFAPAGGASATVGAGGGDSGAGAQFKGDRPLGSPVYERRRGR